MRIRGYDEETEQYVGGIEILTGKIADLTKTANNPAGISLFTDENKTEFKSTTQLLREISEIYDELTDKQQAKLMETLGGKHQGQIIASLISNFDIVEESLRTMANSSGTAMREMETIYDSLDYKINKLTQTGVGIWQNLFPREDIGVAVEFLTSLLNVVDKVTEHLGLFGTAAAGISIALSLKKNPVGELIIQFYSLIILREPRICPRNL